MYFIGKINREIYRCVTESIVSEEVVITENQILHIKERHPGDYERLAKYLQEAVEKPDYIVETNKADTALVLKEIICDETIIKMVIRLVTKHDNPTYKNSIITFMKIDEKEWSRLLRNKKILYYILCQI